MRKPLTYVALIISLLVLCAGNATAAKFHEIHSVCEEYQSASAVFVAYVTDVQKEKGETGYTGLRTVSMRIEESFKGVKESDIVLTYELDFENCMHWFSKDDRWLIYAIRDPQTNVFHETECSRSTRVEFAGSDLRYLRALPEIATKTRLAGVIDQYVQADSGLNYFKHLSGIKIAVTNPQGNRYETYTDIDGVYEFVDLPAGKYKIHAGIPENLKIENPTRIDNEVTLVERGCAEVNISVTPIGSISGQVMDESGKIVSNLEVTLVPVDKTADPISREDTLSKTTDGRGQFEIKNLPPGSYLIGVNIDREPSELAPFPPTFYPGVANLSQAEKLVLKEGEQITGLTLRLPAKIATKVIEGMLVYSDGEVVNKGEIVLADSESIDSYMVYGTGNIAEDGHFSISVLQGTIGWIHAVGFKPPKTPGQWLYI